MCSTGCDSLGVRYDRTAKANVFVHHSPEELVTAMESFARYYNYQRCHEPLGNVAPVHRYDGRRGVTLARMRDVKGKVPAERRMAREGAKSS